jgi:hypothetical protein
MLKKTLAAVSVAALTMSPLAAIAQAELAEDVAAQLQNLGYMPDDLGMLTEDQVMQLETVVNSDVDEDDKKMEIDSILGE